MKTSLKDLYVYLKSIETLTGHIRMTEWLNGSLIRVVPFDLTNMLNGKAVYYFKNGYISLHPEQFNKPRFGNL